MRLAGYSLEDICRTTMTPNERPMLERVDGRTDIYWLEADFRSGSKGDIPMPLAHFRFTPEADIDCL
jgi:hypothetical protein